MNIDRLTEEMKSLLEAKSVNIDELDLDGLIALVGRTIRKYCGKSLETQRRFLVKRGWDLDWKGYERPILIEMYNYFNNHGEFIKDLIDYENK